MTDDDEARRMARHAAIDQQLADIDRRLKRHNDAAVRSGFVIAVVAAGFAVDEAVFRARAPWPLVIALLLVIAMLAAGSAVQALAVRGYRREIRELRTGMRDEP